MLTRGALWGAILITVGFFAALPVRAQGITLRITGDIVVPSGTVHDGFVMTMNGRAFKSRAKSAGMR